MADEADPSVVARARRGDAAAAETLVRQYLRASYAVALGVVRNVADAEDIAQEALMNALQHLDQCRDDSRFTAWLLQGVRNRALNHISQVRTRGGVMQELSRPEATEVDPRRVLVKQRLLSALEVLTAPQREVVLLHDLESWTHAEIAAVLGISEVMSRQHLFVARKAMREQLGSSEKEEVGHERRPN